MNNRCRPTRERSLCITWLIASSLNRTVANHFQLVPTTMPAMCIPWPPSHSWMIEHSKHQHISLCQRTSNTSYRYTLSNDRTSITSKAKEIHSCHLWKLHPWRHCLQSKQGVHKVQHSITDVVTQCYNDELTTSADSTPGQGMFCRWHLCYITSLLGAVWTTCVGLN